MSSIYKQLQLIRNDVDYIVKDTKIKGMNYSAITRDNVIAHVRPKFDEHNVLMLPSLVESETRIVPTKEINSNSSKGSETEFKSKVFYTAVYDFSFIYTDDGSNHTVRVEGHAEDYGDKAAGKALSYAEKNAIIKSLMIETGENDESRLDSEKPITVAQQNIILKLIRKIDDSEDFERKVCDAYGVDSIESLPKSKFDQVSADLKAKHQLIQSGKNNG